MMGDSFSALKMIFHKLRTKIIHPEISHTLGLLKLNMNRKMKVFFSSKIDCSVIQKNHIENCLVWYGFRLVVGVVVTCRSISFADHET